MTEHELGPGCREALAKLYDYLDGELDAAGRERVRAHLEVCRPCLNYFEFERLFHEFVRTKAPRPQAREEFKTGLLERIQAESRKTSGLLGGATPRAMPWFALAASIVLLVVVGAGWLARHGTTGDATWELLADYHYHRVSGAEDGIRTEDPREAYEFVVSRLGEEAGRLVPRNLPGGLRYHEACILPLKSGPAAMLEWRDHQEPVSLVVARPSCLSICSKPKIEWHGRGYHLVSAEGLNMLCWEENGGYVCAIMAPTGFGKMLAWAEEMRGPGGF